MFKWSQRRSKRENEVEKNIWRNKVPKLLNLLTDIEVYIQEAEETPVSINTKGMTPRHIRVKFWKSKDKENITKTWKRKYYSTYRETILRKASALFFQKKNVKENKIEKKNFIEQRKQEKKYSKKPC